MPSDTSTPLEHLSALGQSVWVDFLSRDSIRGGPLQELIDENSVVGATSNPSIWPVSGSRKLSSGMDWSTPTIRYPRLKIAAMVDPAGM